jgi:hypothetical protein
MNQNKTIRGYIMRMLAGSAQNTLLCHQLSRKLIEDKLTGDADIPNIWIICDKKGTSSLPENIQP